MTVKELIEELEKLPKHASVRVLQKWGDDWYVRSFVNTVILQPRDDDDDYLDRYVDIK